MDSKIKFRAWWIIEHKMVSWEDIINPDSRDYILPGLFTEPKRFIPMQYTGLKDKNGKEIYEGDIVTGSVERNHWSIPKEQIYIVTWHEGKFHLSGIDGRLGWIINWHVSSKSTELEVIGNIYENPELLTNN